MFLLADAIEACYFITSLPCCILSFSNNCLFNLTSFSLNLYYLSNTLSFILFPSFSINSIPSSQQSLIVFNDTFSISHSISTHS